MEGIEIPEGLRYSEREMYRVAKILYDDTTTNFQAAIQAKNVLTLLDRIVRMRERQRTLRSDDY
jgi:hypothetical protein